MVPPGRPAPRSQPAREIATLPCRHGTLSFFAKDDPVGRSLVEYGEWAEREIALLVHLVGEGATVLDVGANVGTHTLPLARRVGPKGKVVAFEPQGAICELLAQNVARAHLSMVEVRQEGVAAAPGEMCVPALEYGDHVNAGGVALVAIDGGKATGGERVPVVDVDGLELQRCDLVKLDVEGMEADALRGMRRTIRRCGPYVHAECNRIEAGWEVMRLAHDLGMRALFHRSPAFNPDNFSGKAENTFGHAHETSLLLVPASRLAEAEVLARRWELVPVATLDELAVAMLETPRWGDPERPQLSSMQVARRLAGSQRLLEAQERRVGKLEGQLAGAEQRLQDLTHPIVDRDAERYRGRPVALAAARLRAALRRARGKPVRRAVSATERLVARSGLFDAEFYRANNADLARCTPSELLRHYLDHGGREGRDPCGVFDSSFYLEQNPDVRAAGMNPLVHYLGYGAAEGRNPSPLFDTRFYASHPRVASAGMNPLHHYVRFGAAAGLDPSPAFDTVAWLEAHPEARAEGANPLARRLAERADAPALPGAARLRKAPRPVAPSRAEWEELAARLRARPAPAPAVVDVIVPVYLGLADTLRCLYTVLSAPCRTPHALVVVDDASPDPELRRALDRLASEGLLELVRNERNAGFVATCNRGMRLHPDRDVVLLNSDTEVFGDWLDRLRAAALRSPRVGSVTPLSNSATICSYPFFPHESDLALEVDFAELDRIAAEVNAGQAVPLPTGVGFCMYVRRGCLDEVGLFDLERFGRGYGEENDFSLRAARRGWSHLLATDTFVRHSGAVSFGAEKQARIAEALVKIHERFPDYGASVARFVAADPPREARGRIDLARLERRVTSRAMLFVTHNWGGGIERHVADLQRRVEAEGVAVFQLRPHPQDGRKAVLSHPEAWPTPNVGPFDVGGDPEPLVEALRRLRVTHLHVHSLVGFDQPRAADFVREVARALGAPFDFTVHDYASICPRINLIDGSGRYCGEPSPSACARCVRTNGSPFGTPAVKPWVAAYGRLLRGARAVYAPGRDAARRIAAHFPGVEPRVQPHPERPIDRLPLPSRLRRAEDPLRVAVIGAIGPHKGFEVLRACARDAAERRLPLTFHLVGYSCDDAALTEHGNVTVVGRYDDASLPALLAEQRADCAFFPSVWPETWSYTLSGALAAGLYPVCFDLGVPAERIRDLGWGTLLPLTADPVAVNDALLALPLRPPAGGAPIAPAPDCASVLREYYRLEA